MLQRKGPGRTAPGSVFERHTCAKTLTAHGLSTTTYGLAMATHGLSMASCDLSTAAHRRSMTAHGSALAAYSVTVTAHSPSMAPHGLSIATYSVTITSHSLSTAPRGLSLSAEGLSTTTPTSAYRELRSTNETLDTSPAPTSLRVNHVPDLDGAYSVHVGSLARSSVVYLLFARRHVGQTSLPLPASPAVARPDRP